MRRSLLLVFFLSGCMVGPDYERPKVETPAAYKEGTRAEDWKPAEPRDGAARGQWWAVFADPKLDALIAQVDLSNQTIAAAEAQLRQAAAVTAQNRASLFPEFDGRATVTRAQPSSTTGPIIGNATSTRTLYSLPLSASWEADLWGRIRRSIEQGSAAEAASAADLVNARLSVQSDVATNYFTLRSLDTQRKLLEETVGAFAKTLELTENRYQAGVVSRADVAQARTQLESTRAQLVELGVQRAQTEHALAVLLGKPASDFSIEVAPLAAVPPPVPPGLPAELLERRPDVAAAERRVAAANAQIGVAKSAFFPAATINATLGYQSRSTADWFTLPSRFWSVGPILALTLFDAGRRAAVTDQAIAAYDQTVAVYRNTVLGAFRDVEDNLAALRVLEQEAKVQDEAVKAAQLNLEITLNQYKAGITTYLQVVVAQAAALNNQRAADTLLERRVNATVLLIKALGGGWESKP
jgi:NodT family efflux transporter outer membrane factor (OMF) lipoprotein